MPFAIFNYDRNFKELDFRKNPALYRTGKGEQRVLLIEPYKSEILPHWKFKTPELASLSAKKIYSFFWNIKNSKILWEWIWQENLYRWAIPAAADMPITNPAKNIKALCHREKKVSAVAMAEAF